LEIDPEYKEKIIEDAEKYLRGENPNIIYSTSIEEICQQLSRVTTNLDNSSTGETLMLELLTTADHSGYIELMKTARLFVSHKVIIMLTINMIITAPILTETISNNAEGILRVVRHAKESFECMKNSILNNQASSERTKILDDLNNNPKSKPSTYNRSIRAVGTSLAITGAMAVLGSLINRRQPETLGNTLGDVFKQIIEQLAKNNI
jgi:hypothetical protein